MRNEGHRGRDGKSVGAGEVGGGGGGGGGEREREREREREKLDSCLTISGLACSFEPVCEMTDKVEEEVSIWYADHFVTDLDEEGEPSEVFRPRR